MSLLEKSQKISVPERSFPKTSSERARNIYDFDLVRQRLFLLSRNLVWLQEYFCIWVLQSADDREGDAHFPPPPTRPGFPYTTKLIFGTASTGVQKIQDLFTNSLFVTKKNWCLVCEESKPLDLSNIRERTPECKQRFPQVY